MPQLPNTHALHQIQLNFACKTAPLVHTCLQYFILTRASRCACRARNHKCDWIWNFGGSNRSTVTNHGEIWHVTVSLWCALLCQFHVDQCIISPVWDKKQQIWPNFDYCGSQTRLLQGLHQSTESFLLHKQLIFVCLRGILEIQHVDFTAIIS